MTSDIISVNNLTKSFRVPQKDGNGFWPTLKFLFHREYKQVLAVNGINLSIKQGEIRGLIGPNGAGKSTIIKMISGILYPTEGSIEVMGYTPWVQREDYVKNIGVVLGQKSQLFWDLPPMDTFYLNREIYKIPQKEFKETVDYFEYLLDIKEVIRKPVRNLSLGERMKCELVCAMLHKPQLVYLDEPTIGLDVFAKASIRRFIKEINRDKNVTFILTTHDLDDIENLCNNITIINHGAIVYDDSIEKLKTVFSQKKTIEIKLMRPVEDNVLAQFNPLSASPYSARIEIDLSKSNLQEEVYKIFGTLPVQDINIESISIEEVIKEIYTN